MSKVKKHWKKSEILQEALQYLAMNYEQKNNSLRNQRYICFALDEVVHDLPSLWKQAKEIKSYVNELLVVGDYECGCYEEWLSVVHRVTYKEKHTPEGFKKLQYSRKQWMLWMIEQYKQQGD